MQFKDNIAPLIIGVHCFAHRTNLVVITLSNVPLMHQLKGILQSKYVLFFSQFEIFCRILKACIFFQHQGQQAIGFQCFILQKDSIPSINLSL
jgi:hypothetical protein